ncbi:MAG: PorT family protein [Bacteroidaceae bacterium]|nr:PorT family protein [Bacteroidaceae bacterium]
MKHYLLLLIALVGLTPAYAQFDDNDIFANTNSTPFAKPKKHGFFLGPRIGGTMTMMTQPEQTDLYDAMGFGFSGGLAMKVRLGRMSENSDGGTGIFGIALDLKYKLNSVKTIGIGGDKLNLGYFEVPVMLQLYPFYKNTALNGLYIEAGADFAALVNKSPEAIAVADANRYAIYHTGGLKGFDVRIPVGLGWTLRKGFDVNLRYYISTSNLAENLKCKQSSLELSLAWYFRLAGRNN